MTGDPTRVLRVITRLNVGGPARQALLLSRALRPEYETVLATGTPGEREGELLDDRVPIRRVPLVRPVEPSADARAFAALRRLIDAERPSIVHTHMSKAGAIGRLAAIRSRQRPRTVHTFHGHVLEGYFGPAVQRGVLSAERFLAARTDVLIAISDEVRDALLDRGIGTPSKYRVVSLGLELEPFLAVDGPSGALRRHLGLDADTPLAGAVARLVPIKDHETTFRALRELPDLHLAVIGDGELRAELEARARDLGIADRTHFVGWWGDVAAAVSDLDVVVSSSRNEGTPVALIEALAAARPVVATAVGGTPSVVRQGVTGRLVPPSNEQKLAAAISDVLRDPREAAGLGAAGRADVAGRFGAARLVEEIRALYEELASPRRPVGSRTAS